MTRVRRPIRQIVRAVQFVATSVWRCRSGWGLLLVLAFTPAGAQAGVALESPSELARRIDRILAIRWGAEGVTPAPLADDSTFVRRLFLDLTGRIPTAGETRAFLADDRPEKRARLVARLIDSPAHSRYAATLWRRTWIPQTDANQFPQADELENWLTRRLQGGGTYDRIVHDLLTAVPSPSPTATPTTFLSAGEYKPEVLAANTTRAFLGINLDCAQCHNHPFARWTREQFWETAAFFSRPAQGETRLVAIAIPNTTISVGPRLLTDPQPDWPDRWSDDGGRAILARWITAKENPYFARNAVNRIWAALFGTGLIEPLDDLSGENPATHPEVLAELVRSFVESDYNLKHVTAAIVLSRAYQLSSSGAAAGNDSDRSYSRASVRGLSGEQLYDSLRIAAGLSPERDDLDPQNALRERTQFAERFRVDRAGTAQRSILQSLALMNGRLTAELTSLEKSPTLRAVSEAPFLDTHEKIVALYSATLSREPTTAENSELVPYVESAEGESMRQALADIFWALLNSSEFSTNH